MTKSSKPNESEKKPDAVEAHRENEAPWIWHPLFERRKPKLLTMPRPLAAHLDKPRLAKTRDIDSRAVDNYLSLVAAAERAKCSEARLLKYASEGEIKLCISIPFEISMRPFDTDTECVGLAPQFLPPPDKLILAPKYCEQIKDHLNIEQCDFRKAYLLSFGKPKVLLPGYANPIFARASCTWRAFKQGNSCSIKIKQEDILVAQDELHDFMKKNPQRLSPAPQEFQDAMNEFLNEVVNRAASTKKPFDRFHLPGKRSHLLEVAKKFDEKLNHTDTTFRSYISGLCGFEKKGGPASKVNPFAALFSEIYPSVTTHLIPK